ncbi:aldehyde dehydrogenase (NADP(+)) [Chitinophaga sp. Mgbs1]|uniref:Aldehyde dehydrogenase (NADP(+)) n=1 Tax=Chitinophaga solisilvae TaxID=1233460 RepID=A0A433WMD4_9BACT|nr:aldehyde dehydrogenase (NADP(+)) [Chitinophaga solisilvae]
MQEINTIMEQSQAAFRTYSQLPAAVRAQFLETVAAEIEARREQLVTIAGAETNLPAARLNNEINRTNNQLKMFAAYIREGSWVEAAIDTADAARVPAKPDTRKMLLPAGPVVVFGASNFPFAFSTAGGDTASALAAGCTVVVKAHSAHSGTSREVFTAILKAIAACGMPEHTVQHVEIPGHATGKALVAHPLTTGVGFTGSLQGGKALLEYAAGRENPIPVFAEMSSINPVVFYPDTLSQNADTLAKSYAASITLGMGQFCTNPGLLLAIGSEATDNFLRLLADEIEKTIPQKMLHSGIHASYVRTMETVLSQDGTVLLKTAAQPAQELEATPAVARVNAAQFLQNPHLQEEVFGPFSLAVICEDKTALKQVLATLKGQLTTTAMATPADLETHADILALQTTLAGRIILNDVPTGVEVNASMVHGGPFPATTDARFTSVGTTAARRWVRPVCFQGFTDALLPEALRNSNPLGILRIVNNEWTKSPVV